MTWRLVRRVRGSKTRWSRQAIFECSDCGARIQRRMYGMPRPCWHPLVDEETPYERDAVCQELIAALGPMSLEEIGCALGLTRAAVALIEAAALEKARAAYDRLDERERIEVAA